MRRMSWLLALLIPACGDSSSDASAPAGVQRSAPPSSGEGATIAYSSGHPLDWWSDDSGVLSFEEQVFAFVNQHRTSRGLGTLALDDGLRRCARGHSRHMRADSHAFVAHVNPEGHGPLDRVILCGVPGVMAVAENAAAGQGSPWQVFNDWLNSPAHRENIENPAWTRSGIGYQPGGPGDPLGHYWSQLFVP